VRLPWRVAIELHLLRSSENRSLAQCSLSPLKPCVYVRNRCANARVPGLENRRPFTGLVGSNPTLSATELAEPLRRKLSPIPRLWPGRYAIAARNGCQNPFGLQGRLIRPPGDVDIRPGNTQCVSIGLGNPAEVDI
jgi:hypothetical protein